MERNNRLFHSEGQPAISHAITTSIVTTMKPQSVYSLGPWTEYVDALESYHTSDHDVVLTFSERKLLLALEDFEASGFAAALKEQQLPCKLGLLHTDHSVPERVRWRFI